MSIWFSRLLALGGGVFWIWYALRTIAVPLFLTSDESPSLLAKVGFITYGYAALVSGVLLGGVYREIKARKAGGHDQVDIRRLVSRALKGADFWMAMFASPVVYVILLQAVDLENITLAGFVALTLVGLQNGFVCNTIAEAIAPQQP